MIKHRVVTALAVLLAAVATASMAPPTENAARGVRDNNPRETPLTGVAGAKLLLIYDFEGASQLELGIET